MSTDLFDLSRRYFLKQTGLAAGGGLTILQGSTSSFANDALPTRLLGRTELNVSILGLGTGHLHASPSKKEAVELIRYLRFAGVNFFDTAFNYGAGNSETILGEVFNQERDQIVISTKTQNRRKKGALKELETSLNRLKTDYVDIWQVHNVSQWDFETCFGQNGVMEAMELAKKQGKCRFIGLTGHSNPKDLQIYLRNYTFDTVMMPLNCVDPHYSSFEKELLPELDYHETGIIGMKAFLMGKLLERRDVQPAETLRYCLSLPVSSIIVGCTTVEQAKQDVDVVHHCFPMKDEERFVLNHQVENLSGKPNEWFKRMV